MRNFQKNGLTVNPGVSLLDYGINRLRKEENYYSLFQLKSLSKIWQGSFRKKK